MGMQKKKKKENGEPHRYSWECRRRRMVNPTDIAGNAEVKKKNGELQRYSWECRRRRRMVNPTDIAGNAEEEEEKEEEW